MIPCLYVITFYIIKFHSTKYNNVKCNACIGGLIHLAVLIITIYIVTNITYLFNVFLPISITLRLICLDSRHLDTCNLRSIIDSDLFLNQNFQNFLILMLTYVIKILEMNNFLKSMLQLKIKLLFQFQKPMFNDVFSINFS